MSAYLVSHEHIDYLVGAATSRRLSQGDCRLYWWWNGVNRQLHSGDAHVADRIGQMLWDENLASLKSRYPDVVGDAATPEAWDMTPYPGHVFRLWQTVDPVQVLKSCDCYEYQACEHEGWEGSEARAFIVALRHAAWHALPGYDEAEWGPPKALEKVTS